MSKGFPINHTIIYFYLPRSDIFINCGRYPFRYQITLPIDNLEKDEKPEVHNFYFCCVFINFA